MQAVWNAFPFVWARTERHLLIAAKLMILIVTTTYRLINQATPISFYAVANNLHRSRILTSFEMLKWHRIIRCAFGGITAQPPCLN